jgi:acyl-CoA thioesterase-1
VPQLQHWLDAKGADAKVLNAGVSGDTTAGGLARLGWTLSPDVDALIVNLGGNDMLRGIDPTAARANLDAILATAKKDKLPVLLVGFSAPGNYGPEYKQAFDAIYPELAKTYGTLLIPNFFRPLTNGANPAMVDRTLMQPDGIHPSKDGVARIVDSFGPTVLELIKKAK